MTRKILIVDDNLETKRLKEEVFRFSDFEVLSATNGKEALTIARSSTNISIVLCDNQYSGITGVDFVDKMKKNEGTHKIPIVMLATTHGGFDGYEKDIMRKKGVSEYILKPFNVEYLIKKVKELAKKHHASVLN